MIAKEYLSQAYYLDQRINSKIEQIASLNELARKDTVTISDMPGKAAMASAVEKIIDLEAEINAEVEKLVDLKVEITKAIKQVGDRNYQVLLEKRYLCFQTEQRCGRQDADLWHVFVHWRLVRADDLYLPGTVPGARGKQRAFV